MEWINVDLQKLASNSKTHSRTWLLPDILVHNLASSRPNPKRCTSTLPQMFAVPVRTSTWRPTQYSNSATQFAVKNAVPGKILYCCRLTQSWWLKVVGWGGQTAICSPTATLILLSDMHLGEVQLCLMRAG